MTRCVSDAFNYSAHFMAVMPAKAGIHVRECIKAKWMPAFAGMTTMGA
jgi:hypothetical protein